MSSNPEKQAWSALRKSIITVMPHVIIERIENRVSSGIPDAYLATSNGHVWLEGKATSRPISGSFNIGLRRSQLNWMRRATKSGIACRIWFANLQRGAWRYTLIDPAVPDTAPWFHGAIDINTLTFHSSLEVAKHITCDL